MAATPTVGIEQTPPPSGESLPRIGDWKSFTELRALQESRIPGVLSRAACAPFYRNRWLGWEPSTAADFATLATTTKADLHDSYPAEMLAVSNEQVSMYLESSGSNGRPTPAFYTESDWQDLAERYARKPTDMHPSDVFFVRTPLALGLAGHLAIRAGHLTGATVVPGDNRSSVIPFARVVRVLHDLDVTLTWSNPTDCLMWAAACRHAGLNPRTDFPKLRAIFVGGEPLSPARRDRITQIWGVPVIDEYGCTEVGSLACRCREGELHFWADRVKPEVYDPSTGAISTEGTGELVVTPLHLQAMPLIRYNLHDSVELTYDDCPCGWYLPHIRVFGRGATAFPVADRPVTQFAVETAVFSLPLELGVLFWRAKAEPDRLRVQFEVAEERAAAARAALESALDRELGVPHELESLPPGTLVPERVLASSRQSQKPRTLFGPEESWENSLLFSEG